MWSRHVRVVMAASTPLYVLTTADRLAIYVELVGPIHTEQLISCDLS